MKLGMLIEAFQELDPNLDVMLSKDSEGNKIKDFEGWATGHWSGELDEFWSEEDIEDVEDEDEEPLTVNTVVLYPF